MEGRGDVERLCCSTVGGRNIITRTIEDHDDDGMAEKVDRGSQPRILAVLPSLGPECKEDRWWYLLETYTAP